jgi:hypothetical protein
MSPSNKPIPKDKEPAFSPDRPGNFRKIPSTPDLDGEPVEEKSEKIKPANGNGQGTWQDKKQSER